MKNSIFAGSSAISLKKLHMKFVLNIEKVRFRLVITTFSPLQLIQFTSMSHLLSI
jgi:hypothetical protein